MGFFISLNLYFSRHTFFFAIQIKQKRKLTVIFFPLFRTFIKAILEPWAAI